MIFDQYSRYYACSLMLKHIIKTKNDQILDVGSGPECLLKEFYLDSNITFLDPLISSEDSQHISGNIFSSHLENANFSVVLSVDTLEHIAPNLRGTFLNRISKLASDSIILGFPSSDQPTPIETDRIVNNKFQDVYGIEYPWLKEHYEYGLPSIKETQEKLTQNGWHCQVVGHGHAPWLSELLGFVICVWEQPEYKDLIFSLSEHFNNDLVNHDFTGPFYRQFIIATKKPILPFIPPKTKLDFAAADVIFKRLMKNAWSQYLVLSIKKDTKLKDKFIQLEEILLNKLTKKDSELDQKNNELIQKDSELDHKDNEITQKNDSIAQKDNEITQKDNEITQKDNEITHKDNEITQKDNEITQKDNEITQKDNEITQKDNEITQKDNEITQKDNEITQKNNEIIQITISKSWRITKPFRYVVNSVRSIFNPKDRFHFIEKLRNRYGKLPLPFFVKKLTRIIFKKLIHNQNNSIYHGVTHDMLSPFSEIKPGIRQIGKSDYVIWGVIDWHFRHQRPQQLALSIASTGRRVFYVSVDLIDHKEGGFNVERLSTEGEIFQVKLFAKGAPIIYNNAPSSETIEQLIKSIGEVLTWAHSDSIVNLINHPFWLDIATVLPNSRVVYDCMDHHEGFGDNTSFLIELEKRLLKEAELTITTSTWLDEFVAPEANRRVLIRNAGDYKHFSVKPVDVYSDTKGRKIIGYYGAIAHWFDLDLVEKVAKQHPDCSILLIGADTVNARARLSKLPNITFIGEVSYNKLPYYLYSFDVCILPFKVIPLTLATNPVKAYEYLSAGKPVVTVDLPEMKQFEGLIYKANGHEVFLKVLHTVLNKPESKLLLQERRIFSKGQTWQHRAEILISNCESTEYDRQVSVVVVTYNNLDFTKACLTSIDQHSQYENMEIIVVDNGSIDGSQEYLTNWVKGNSNRKLILNENNRGFAAANNQGLDIAIGNYLVMLNNDTYVTPGWIRTLLSHLDRDKTIGLIGPVTNNIGNEAMIKIDYSNMEDMILKSAKYTNRHIGQTFPIKTLAFFCVMMPRSTYDCVGKLDEIFGQGFFEDDDYCRRIEQKGLRIVCAEDTFIHHHLSASFSKLKHEERQRLFDDNKKKYESKWGKWNPHKYKVNK